MDKNEQNVSKVKNEKQDQKDKKTELKEMNQDTWVILARLAVWMLLSFRG